MSGSGFAYALDGGLRFARQWYIGLTFEHAGLGGGRDVTAIAAGASSPTSNTSAVGAVLGLIANPDAPSFFGQIGLQGRWYNVGWTDLLGRQQSGNYTGGELLLGAGVWVPLGAHFRLLPEATAGIGTFNAPSSGVGAMTTGSSQNNPGHAFFMIGIAGFYNADF
jgi:hypothetical protein